MPLRDHFRPPLDNKRHWEGFLAGWPAMMVQTLQRKLPRGYAAAPLIHSSSYTEFGSPTDDNDDLDSRVVWIPELPTLAVETDLPAPDEYEVRVYDSKCGRRLISAVEIVSPANKDRPEHRRAFVARCAALMQSRVPVTIVDLVTTRNANLYRELLGLIGQADPSLEPVPPPLYAVACRTTKRGNDWMLETWLETLQIGQPLPTLPLWLADNLAVPLELEASYEETCRILRIP